VRIGFAAAGVLAATFVPSVASADPASTPGKQPSVADVQKQLSALAVTNAQLVEQYNQAYIAVKKRETAATQAQTVATAAAAKYGTARTTLATTVAAQYEGGAFSTTGALLASSNGASYLQQLETLSMISSHRAEVVATLTAARAAADSAKKTAKQALSAARAKLTVLDQRKKDVETQLDKYKNLLDTLTVQQQAVVQKQISPSVTSNVVAEQRLKVDKTVTRGAAAAATQAVKYALAQVNKPYQYGSPGPNSYDCSGLTMASYAEAGISLPHSAAEQYNYGHHVAYGQWKAGDLLFYYSPISHVTIYVGDGLMVSAPETGENVKVMAVNLMSGYVGATRLI
jgi:cell wall-associated NlpC family hydrolase